MKWVQILYKSFFTATSAVTLRHTHSCELKNNEINSIKKFKFNKMIKMKKTEENEMKIQLNNKIYQNFNKNNNNNNNNNDNDHDNMISKVLLK